MSDVITRFKLETTQYDSKLRDEAKRLAEFTRLCSTAGSEFGKFAQKNVEAARALGSFTPSANNAKDKVKELVGAFNDAAKAYNALTKEQQQSDFGRALAGSMERLLVKIREAKQELYGLDGAMKKVDGGGLFSGMGDKMSGALQVFAGNMMTKGVSMVAGLASEIGDCVKQGVELARQGEGIRIAFERLGRGDILQGLREATHGTVTDLELMKAAVKFNDFKLPLDELGTMLAFAQQKAKDTGQSVDYMVDSIVTGLGRKSLMILDNLGLSATEVKERMAETGDMTKAVGDIIREQMSKAGDYVETAADRAAQANVSLQNKMEELGRKFAPLEEASNNFWTSMKIGILDIVGGPLARLLNGLTEAGRLKNALNDMNGEPGSGNTKVDQQLKKLNVIKKAGGSDYYFQSTLSGMVEDYNRQIIAFDNQIKDLSKKAGEDTEGNMAAVYEGRIRDIETKQNALRTMRDQLEAGAKELSKPVDIKIDTKDAEQNIKGLGGTTGTGTHTATPQQRANEKYVQADKDYQQALAQAALQLKAGTITEADAKKKELQARENLWKSIGDAREIYDSPQLKAAQDKVEAEIVKYGGEVTAAIEAQKNAQKAARELEAAQKKLAAAQQKLADARATGSATAVFQAQQDVRKQQVQVEYLQGKVPEGQVVEYTIEVNADQLEKLKNLPTDDKTIRVNVEQGNINLPEVPTNDETIKVNVEQGNINLPEVPTNDETIKVNVEQGKIDLPQVPTDDKTIRVNVTAMTDDARKAVQQFITDTSSKPVEVKIKPVKDGTQDNMFGNLVQSIEAEIKMDQMKVDETTLRTLLTTAIQNGLNEVTVDYAGLQEKIAKGIDIPEETWQELQDEINAKLQEMGVEPIQIDFKTGEAKSQSKEMTKDWKEAASAIQQVGSAMASIEDPAAKVVGTVAQAIATIALSYAQATAKTSGPWEWIAFAATGLATMISTISAIHSATGYANGGMVDGSGGGRIDGTTYSSDQIPIMANAGEIVLNTAQQQNVAQGLQNSGLRGLNLKTKVKGTELLVWLDNSLAQSGRGELVTWE